MRTVVKTRAGVIERVRPSSLRVDRAFATILPEPQNMEGLRESIRKHGVLVPLLITRAGLVLDGHHRLLLARELSIMDVPVIRLDLDASGWKKAVAIASNLHRRHLLEAQRVALGSSLERIERVKAKQRQQSAGGDRRARRTASAHGEPKRSDEGKTTAVVAAQVGVSRMTYERARAVIDGAPADVVTRMLAGELSVAGAHAKLRRRQLARRARADERVHVPGIWRGDLHDVPKGVYRCLYVDPPWQYDDEGGSEGTAASIYPTLSVADLAGLNVGGLAHPNGAHVWLWTTWPMIRDQAPHRVLDAWGFRWVGEVVWDKITPTTGRWIRSTTEVCVLGVRGRLPLMADEALSGLVRARRRGHSTKPHEMRALIERCSPGPRIELFGRSVPEGWHAWGQEAKRGRG